MYCVIKCVKNKRVLKGNFASSVFHICNAKDVNLRHRTAMCSLFEWIAMLNDCGWLCSWTGWGSANRLSVWQCQQSAWLDTHIL
jgi:hypothetical protein